jgi:hypothetical protein
MGHPQAYGVFHYLYDSLFDDYFFPVKKLYHKIIFHLFSKVDDIRGHKDNMYASKKTPNKIWYKVSREYIKLPIFTKYQKTKKNHLETQINAQNQQKTESINKNNSSLANFFASYKHVRKFC